MTAFVIAADDRTGALETAGSCVDRGCDAVVVPWAVDVVQAGGCVVVDLDSRHLSPPEAGARAASISPGAAHKIDSTLRGNWAHELVARQRATSRAVLVVAAFPAAGRTCVDGIVLVEGVPVAEGHAASDVRSPTRSSRPADHLRDAGASAVDSVTPDTVERWLASPPAPFAVCDAATTEDLHRVAKAWAHTPDVVLAGTAAMIATVAGLVSPVGRRAVSRPVCAAPVLIVCGSLHPMALSQVAAVEAAGATVLLASAREGDDASAIAAALGAAAQEALASGAYRTVMIVGGDTAAAVLGDRVVRVGGTLAPGVAWCRPWGDDGALLLTKPGGFGTPSTLVDLLDGGGS